MTARAEGADPARLAQEHDHSRLIARLATEFVLRALQQAAAQHDGDLVRAVVAAAIVAANTAHLNPFSENPGRHVDAGDLPPDEARRPVSVLAVAGSLGLPFETTRRHVNKLIAEGRVRRVKGGVIGLSQAIDDPRNLELISATAANVRRLFRELNRAGVNLG